MTKLYRFMGLKVFPALFLLAIFAQDAMAQGKLDNTPKGSGDKNGSTLGSVIQNVIDSTLTLPGLLSAFAYIFGLYLGVVAIVKLKDHVENPGQTKISESMKRFLAGGAFFLLPYVMTVMMKTVKGGGSDVTNGGFNGESTGTGLDAMIVRLMSDIFVPAQFIFGWFGYIAGIILVMIGISRLLQTEQQGPKGPAGIGTIMTFIVAGCLFSINSMISFINGSVFGTNSLKTNGVLAYTDGLAGAETHVHAVISAVVAFAMILGWISLLRGFFIVRGVSEGDNQASMMAAITHIIGGAMAINLGAIINAVQRTLGIQMYGITFS